jgi:hypothetical protein
MIINSLYENQIFRRCSLFLSGLAKDLSAHLYLVGQIFPTAELLKNRYSRHVTVCRRLNPNRPGEEPSCLHLPDQAVQADWT